MKRTLLLTLLFGLLGLAWVANLGAETLYDDFQGTFIKKTLWRDQPADGQYLHEFVREIDADRGVLVLKLGTNERRTPMRNPLGFRNSRSVTRIQTDVRVMAVNIDASPQADTATVFARIAGYYYNAVNSEPTDDIGDVVAELCIGDRGNGLEAWYRIEEIAGAGWGQVHDRGQGTLAPDLNTNTTYTLDVEYTPPGLFTFSVYQGLNRIGYAQVEGPTYAGPSLEPKKGLGLGVQDLYEEWGDGYIHAEFENVHVNGEEAVYDTFSDARFDEDRWVGREYVRETSGGEARLHTQAVDGTNRSRLLLQDAHTPYLEARVRVSSDSDMSGGALGQARIGGYYYNQTHDRDTFIDHEGEVWAQLAVEMTSDDNLQLVGLIMAANAEKTEWTELYRRQFDTAILFNSYDRLVLEFNDGIFKFSCNGTLLDEVTVETDIFPSTVSKRVVESVVLVEDVQTGILKANFDDVKVANPAQDGTGTWISETSEVVVDPAGCGGPAPSVIATVSQTGCELTVVDSLGHVTGGVMSGSRMLGRGDFLGEGQQTDFEIDAIFNDADQGAGTLTFESTNGCKGYSRITFTRAYALDLQTRGQGSASADPAEGPYAVGTIVTLAAEPAAGYEFAGWEGNVADATQATTTIAMTADQTATAVFAPIGGMFDLTVNQTGQGAVAVDPSTGPYAAGTSVSLTATAADGWAFVRWTGNVADATAAATTIIMADNETVTAQFVETAQDSDADDVPDHLEYGPGGSDPAYDGNGDGVADSTQGNVSSCPTFDKGHYATLSVAAPLSLADVAMVGNPSPDDAPADTTFDWGFMQFTITGVPAGGAADIQIHLPAGSAPESYHKYGPTAADAGNHWYGFEYNAATGLGAEYNGNVITLHLHDGADGDDDLAADGRIIDIGAPATATAVPAGNPPPANTGGGGGGGGCFIDAMH